MRKPGPRAQELLNEYEERRLAQQRARSIADFGRLGVHGEPVLRCSRLGCVDAASWWLGRADGKEAMRCGPHSLASATTDRRQIDPFDWRSLPADPFIQGAAS